MRILILHAINEPAALRRTTLNQSFCMPKHAPWHDYTFHAMAHDTAPLQGRTFDVILLDTTFLCHRWIRPRFLFDQLLERYDFVRRSPALKLAFPQDDYDHAGALDRWLADWGVSIVFTPLARFAEVLYPQTRQVAEIVPSQTGYVDPADSAALAASRARPFEARRIDVGYRARALPPYFGRTGQLKSRIGEIFMKGLPAGHGLVMDVSTDSARTLTGHDWLDFLGDCRFFLGTASGSSLLDVEGEIRDRVEEFARANPQADFEQTAAACFPGLDGRHVMTALGPRHLEAALARTCQILVPDEGLFPLEPGVHYIPMQADGGDIGRVLDEMQDRARVLTRIDAAHALLAQSREFSYSGFVERIQQRISRRAPAMGPAPVASTELAGETPGEMAARERYIVNELVQQQLVDQRSQALHLYSEVERLSLRNEQVGRQLEVLQATDQALTRRNEELSQKLEVLQATNQALGRQNEGLGQQLEDLQATNQALTRRNEELSQQLEEKVSQLAEARLQTDRRRSWRGAVRELAGVNAFLDAQGGPTRRAPAVLVYRALTSVRRRGLAGLWSRLRQHSAQAYSSLPAQRKSVLDAVQRPVLGTITMLVPDDRIDRRVLLSARTLQGAGWRVTVVAAPYPGPVDGDKVTFPDIEIVRIDTSRAPDPIALPADIERTIGKHGGIYFYHLAFLKVALRHPAALYVAHDLPVLPAAALAARVFGVPLAYDAHELYPEQHHFPQERKDAYTRAERDLAPLAQLITTVNLSIAREMAQRYGIPEPHVVLNAPEAAPQDLPIAGADALRRGLGIPAGTRIVLFQGSLSLNRNIEGLVRAMQHVRTPDAVLVVMGPGDEKRAELRAIAEDAGLGPERVVFAPPVPQNELLRMTASADIGVIPYPPIDLNSLYCTPNKLFEYIVAGLPILANDLPELHRFVADNGFGLVRDLSTPKAIAAAIDEMLAADLSAIRCRLLARQSEYVWEAQGARVVELYNARFARAGEPGTGEMQACVESQA